MEQAASEVLAQAGNSICRVVQIPHAGVRILELRMTLLLCQLSLKPWTASRVVGRAALRPAFMIAVSSQSGCFRRWTSHGPVQQALSSSSAKSNANCAVIWSMQTHRGRENKLCSYQAKAWEGKLGEGSVTASFLIGSYAHAGYTEAKPMVFCGMFPSDGDQFEDLREALGKLQLNDSALSFEPEVGNHFVMYSTAFL